MDERLRGLLGDVYSEGRRHDAAKEDRLERLRNVEPDTAALLALLVRAIRPAAILELGTSNGYSTVWLADAARDVGASVLSVDIDPARTEQARANLRLAGLEERVTLRSGDAGETLAGCQSDSLGLVFLDAERPSYPAYWPDLLRSLLPGGLLVVDNVISHAEEVVEFRGLLEAEATVTEALVPTGAGALLVVKAPDAG